MFHLIYLAAGYSTRFGSNKLLYEQGGKPLYRHVLDRLAAIVEEGNLPCGLTVVTQYDEIAEGCGDLPCGVAINEDPSRGISSSLQTGIEFLEARNAIGEDDYLVFFNADQPDLKKTTIEDFLTAAEYSGQPLAALGRDDEMLSPCLFHASLIPKLMALKGDRGGKVILEERREQVFLFSGVGDEELEDIDTL